MPKVVTFGEVMLRLSTPGYLRFSQAHQFDATFGGGEANVAVSLANYGIDTQFVTRLPKNDIADMCVAELRGFGVGTDGIVYGGDRVGIYYLETGAVARGSKVVYDRAHSAISEIQPGMVDWRKVLEGADWFHWTGITPALSQGAADACLEAIKVANEMGVKVSCDLNYRKKLWKYGKSASEVMPALVQGCDLILGNEEDAEKEFGIKPEGFDADCDALYCAGDFSALGAIEAARERGLRIPEDFGIVGTANEAFTALMTPSMSSLALNPFEMGRQAAQAFLAGEEGTVVVPMELKVRESSCRNKLQNLSI